MLKNIIIVSWRNIKRNKKLSIINVTSLSLGMTFLLLISLWIHDEYRVNRFHETIDDLYRLRTNAHWGDLQTFTSTPGPLRDALVENVPEVKGATRLSGNMDFLLTVDARNIMSSGLHVDPDFVEMFSFDVVKGDAFAALSSPDEIVITEHTAERLFGHNDPLGMVIEIEKNTSVKIGAVIKDPSEHSEIDFEWLLPWVMFESEREWATKWGNISFLTFVQLVSDVDVETVSNKIKTIGKASEHDLEFIMQPFADQYLYENYEAGVQTGGRIEYLKLFGAIAIFLLIIACINFMNISSARASTREKEIGVRKTMGASRRSLIFQYIFESITIATISFGVALVLAWFLLSQFNTIFEKEIHLPLSATLFWVGAILLILVSGILAGSYPAIMLSKLRPKQILKVAGAVDSDRSIYVRKTLVVFQFSISIFLILTTLIIGSQVDYIRHANLGLNRDNLFFTEIDPAQYQLIRNQLRQSDAIKSTTTTSDNPMSLRSSSGDLSWPGKPDDEMVLLAPLQVGDDFIKTMELELLQGRALSSAYPTDTSNYVINEETARRLAMDDPVGKEITFWNGTGRIVGLIKDYHLESLHATIRPQILVYEKDNPLLWVKPKASKVEEAIQAVKEAYLSLNPDYPFEFAFADDEYEKAYQNEMLTAKIANIFSLIAIIILGLGLLGLTTFTAERKRKEFSIRKVLGASILNLLQLMSREFFLLICIAGVVGTSLGWYVLQKWMQNFAYGVNMQLWQIFMAFAIPLIITIFTIGTVAISTFKNNPAEVLKNE